MSGQGSISSRERIYQNYRGDGEQIFTHFSESEGAGWADGESEASHQFIEEPKPIVNQCLKCKSNIDTKSRYCRYCYETRRQWMPASPTRKLRKRVHSNTLVSSSNGKTNENNAVFSKAHKQEPVNSAPSTFLQSHKRSSITAASISTEESDFDFEIERLRDRMNRRTYTSGVRKLKIREEDKDLWSDDPLEEHYCIMCKIRPRNVLLAHGQTAHQCVCGVCALRLRKKHRLCPECGKFFEYIIKLV